MIEETELEGIARAMALAYKTTNNRENAVIQVLRLYSSCSSEVARAMWESIDAYVDRYMEFDDMTKK